MSSPLRTALITLTLVVVALGTGVTPAAAVSSTTYEKQVLTRTNMYRVEHEKVEVKHQSCVDRWAEGQARWMAKHGKLQHRSGRLGDIMEDCELTGASENIAYGYTSGNKVVDGWMGSTGHRRNLLSTKMRYIGVGAVKDDDGVWWAAQVFGTRK